LLSIDYSQPQQHMKVEVVHTPAVPPGSTLQNGRAGSVHSSLDAQVVVQMQIGVGPTAPQHSQPSPSAHPTVDSGSQAVGPASPPPPSPPASPVPASQVNPQNTPDSSGAQNPHSGGPQQDDPGPQVAPPQGPPALLSGPPESRVLESTVTLVSSPASGRPSSPHPLETSARMRRASLAMDEAYRMSLPQNRGG
jgi:hypothetical protein